IKLENLPRYEDLIKPEVNTEVKLDNLQEVNTLPFFEPKVVKKDEPEEKPANNRRFKILSRCFAVVGVLLFSLVMINGVTLAILSNDIKDNQKEVTTLTQEVDQLQQEYEVVNANNPEAEKVGYKLALPRNYPDDTSELTWFDKLSIFLMKLFG
ncbi:MAG: hypothetical protein ACLRFE_02000, partial [Clostridia bacterium]